MKDNYIYNERKNKFIVANKTEVLNNLIEYRIFDLETICYKLNKK